jgi:SAM-dependent methyltransferase
MSVFRNYARYYDLFYQGKSYDLEADFVSRILKKFYGDPRRIIELGCGTGRHAEQLARRGYQVHGVDRSPEMVVQAQERAANLPSDLRSKLSFSLGDARDLRTGETYDAVLSLFHVVSYQNSNDDVIAMFSTASEHLRGGVDGGVFVFDCWYGPAVLSDRPQVRTRRMSDDKVDVIRIAEPVMHPNHNLVDVNYTVLIKDRAEKTVEEIHEKHTMRYFFQPELERMLNQAGFELLAAQEWLSDRPLDFTTWLGTFVAKKT